MRLITKQLIELNTQIQDLKNNINTAINYKKINPDLTSGNLIILNNLILSSSDALLTLKKLYNFNLTLN
mgnify:CR=1 FL=1